MSDFLHHNGHIIPATAWSISPDNRSFRYGDGFFETIKMVHGKIALQDLHFERLFSSLEKLKFTRPEFLTTSYLEDAITALVHQLGVADSARVRMTIYRGDGGPADITDLSPNILIQAWPLNKVVNTFQSKGLAAGLYTDARKAADHFSAIKSNNYQCYLMAALWAKEQGLDDAIVLNTLGRIADASIANVFIVKNGTIKTPAISEGCIGGVMRRYLLGCMRKEGIPVFETEITIDELLGASEIFLTNAIIGIKWVQSLQGNSFAGSMAEHLHNKFIKNTLW